LKEHLVWKIGAQPLFFHFDLDSSSLGFNGSKYVQIGSGNYSWTPNFNSNNEFNVGNNSVVEIEVDMEKKVIYYFINNKQCPYYISDVSSSPLLFGISALNSNAILEVLSVKKMRKSSVDPSVPCKAMKWKKK
jgi:hypothetical protein